jgi:hypothetical protein
MKTADKDSSRPLSLRYTHLRQYLRHNKKQKADGNTDKTQGTTAGSHGKKCRGVVAERQRGGWDFRVNYLPDMIIIPPTCTGQQPVECAPVFCGTNRMCGLC